MSQRYGRWMRKAPRMRRVRSDPKIPVARQRALGIIRPQSKLERLMELALKYAKLSFEQEKWIGPYRADFYVPIQKGIVKPWVIEVDGYYTHRTPRGRLHDMRKDNYLRAQGCTVCRFDGVLVQQNPNGCVQSFLLKARAA